MRKKHVAQNTNTTNTGNSGGDRKDARDHSACLRDAVV